MRSKSPETKRKILEFVEEYYIKNGCSPSTTIIANAVGIARGTAYRYLVEMNQNGMIQYDGNEIITDVIRKRKVDKVPAAIVTSIPYDIHKIDEEIIDKYVSLPASIFGKGDYYILRATGDSMIDAGINENDLLVIEKSSTARIGDIVVALDDFNKHTLIKYAGHKDNQYILEYMNQDKYPDKKIYVENLIVQGVLVNSIKFFNKEDIS